MNYKEQVVSLKALVETLEKGLALQENFIKTTAAFVEKQNKFIERQDELLQETQRKLATMYRMMHDDWENDYGHGLFSTWPAMRPRMKKSDASS